MAIFSNQATLTYNGGSASSNIAYGEILEVLAATKTAVEGTYSPDTPVTYAVTLRNTGTSALNGVSVTDDLGAYTVGTATVYPLTYEAGSATLFIDGVLQAAPAVTAGPPLVFTGINLPGGSDAVLIYQARTNAYADPGATGVITNTATVTAAGLNVPVTASETVNAAVAPVLTVSKSISPSQVVDNQQITYTFVIRNTGNTPVVATDNAVITDTFDPILSGLSVNLDGVTWTEGVQYTYNETTGQFNSIPGQITVPAATYTQDLATGVWSVTPGVVILTISGTV